MFVHRATCAIILCFVGSAICGGSSTEKSSNRIEAEESMEVGGDRDFDSVADSSVTSYSSVINHQVPGQSDGSSGEDQENRGSQSKSYFSMQNSHSSKISLNRVKDEQFYRRPSHSAPTSGSSTPAASTASPATQSSPRYEPVRTKLREVNAEPVRSTFSRLKHFETDFKPIEAPTTEGTRRPTRLVSQHYSPHHHTSTEDDGSQEIFRKKPKYREFDHSGEYSSDFSHKYEKEPKETRKPLYRHEDFRKPFNGGSYKQFNGASETKYHDYSDVYQTSPATYNTPTPPPGMSEELMEALLQQQPQTFGDTDKFKHYSSKKKFKSADGPTTFNVGYSIGFGSPPSDDVVVGRPKGQGLKVHVNGEKSIWKQMNGGVEMSHEMSKVKPVQFRVQDSTERPKLNVLQNEGPVFYMNNNSPDIANVPTVGKSTFDHNHALTSSNLFDFSNAVQGPIALPLVGNLGLESRLVPSKTKSGRNVDLMNLYQPMPYSPPVPVLIPSGTKGEPQMVHAIVIPLQNLPNMDLGWGQLSALYGAPAHPAAVGSPAHHSVSFEPSVSFGPTQPQYAHSQSAFQSNNHVASNPFPAIPEKVRTPKYYRKSKDSYKSGSDFSSPIVVYPLPQTGKRELQNELNAILAREMSRKNQRHAPLGLRPPPPQ